MDSPQSLPGTSTAFPAGNAVELALLYAATREMWLIVNFCT